MITEYQVVPKSWRKYVITRDQYRNRRTTKPSFQTILSRPRKLNSRPITHESTKLLLSGKTLLVPSKSTNRDRAFAYLYRVAAIREKKLRVHDFQNIDKGILKGYLVWMDDAA